MLAHTFTQRQLEEVGTGLDALLQGNLLDEEERKVAKTLKSRVEVGKPSKFSSRPEYVTFHTVSDKEEEILEVIMEALWRKR